MGTRVRPGAGGTTRRRRGRRWRARHALVAATAVLALVGTGCDAVGDAVGDAAGELSGAAASEAQRQVDRVRDRVGDEVAERVQDAVVQYGGTIDVDRVCELVGDDRLTNSERGRLEVAVELADALGLPADVVGPAGELLDTTSGATDRVGDLVEACKAAGASMQDGS
jgi:hypothetical protein